MTAIGIYRLFAAAMLFVVWVTQMVSVSSIISPEDPVYNASVSVPFVERVADKYVGDCLAYAWVQAYDNDSPTDATAITTNQVSKYFTDCLNTAASWIEGNLDYVSSVKFVGVTVYRKDWNTWETAVPAIELEFNFPLSRLGYTGDISAKYSIPSKKKMTITPTGYVVIGTGRGQYRIVVWNDYTGEVEVNGVWPR